MTTNDSRRTRRELLINGRRVRLLDLIQADLLEPKQELFYQQHATSEPHRAVVTDRGRIRLSDGREFGTPSAAAAAAADVSAVAGWAAWRVGSDGPALHQLRQQLLEAVAEEVSKDASVSGQQVDETRRRFAALNDARQKAEAGNPDVMSVRDLLKLWTVEDRDREVALQIDADLANHGLRTEPDFRAVSLDKSLRMVLLGDSTGATPSGPTVDSPAAVEEVSVDIGLTLGNLLHETRSLSSVTPTDSFDKAITIMQLNDYSQLAVLEDGTLRGAVSWKSIAEARHRNPDAPFVDAIDRDARVFDYDVRLLDVLKELREHDFIFVRDFDGAVAGIITSSDVVDKYDETATPFFLIGEVDQELRQLIQTTFEHDAIRAACATSGSRFRSVDNMTIGQYQAVLNDPVCWSTLGWPIHQALFIERLAEIRHVRNKVMHFSHDPVKAGDVTKLKNFLQLIRRYTQ